MAKIKKFEDIESWKRARSLAKDVYEVTATGKFAHDFGLKDQIRRASVSILSNIAEGFERGGDKEFLQFLALARDLAAKRGRSFMLRSISSTFRLLSSRR
jgi:hypothetical protein